MGNKVTWARFPPPYTVTHLLPQNASNITKAGEEKSFVNRSQFGLARVDHLGSETKRAGVLVTNSSLVGLINK